MKALLHVFLSFSYTLKHFFFLPVEDLRPERKEKENEKAEKEKEKEKERERIDQTRVRVIGIPTKNPHDKTPPTKSPPTTSPTTISPATKTPNYGIQTKNPHFNPE